MKELAYLNKYLYKYKFHLILGTLFIVVGNLFAIVPAVIVRNTFDILHRNYEIFNLFDGFILQSETEKLFANNIVILGGLVLLSALFRGVFLFFTRQTIIVMSRHIEFDLKNEIYAHYQELPISFYKKRSTGDLMARISEDVSKVRMYLGPALMYGISLLTLFLMVIPYMASVNLQLTFYSLLPLPVLSFAIYFVSGVVNKRSDLIQKSLSRLSSFTQEAFSGIRVIKSFCREKIMGEGFSDESKLYRKQSLKLAFVQALFMPLIMGLIGLSVILTIYIGSVEVFNGTISTGNIAEFVIYVNLLTWPVTSLGWITAIVQRAAASQRRINEFMKEKNNIVSLKEIEKTIEGVIEFNQVGFTYPDTGIEALKDISFKIEKGESLAIVGTTGSGKSTIANLVERLFDIDKGEILIDNIPITHYAISTLRKQIGYVPQDVFLFSTTIGKNIAFSNENASNVAINKAAQQADLLENIQQFKEGFETMVGERGITLSGGQKQRVSIARAIIKNPTILILDDALSAVDTATENNILHALKEVMKNKTILIVSQRISSAKLADKIIMLHDGKIIEQGTHDELIKKAGSYKELYEKQLQADDKTIEVL